MACHPQLMTLNRPPHLTCHRAELTPPPLPRTPTKTFVQVFTFSKSLTYNWANLKDLCNRGINVQVTFQYITNKNSICMKSQPLRHRVQRMLFKCNTQFVLLTLQIICHGQPEHDTTFENS